ncbi:MAG TPA: hypothetical protein VII94_01990 [Candidatus Saccharimonadales bacterium]
MTLKTRFTDSFEDNYSFYFFKGINRNKHISISIKFKNKSRSIEILGYAAEYFSFALPLIDDEISWHAYDTHDFRPHRKACMSPEAINFAEKIVKLKVFL